MVILKDIWRRELLSLLTSINSHVPFSSHGVCIYACDVNMQGAADRTVSALSEAVQGSLSECWAEGGLALIMMKHLSGEKNLREEESWFAAGLFEDRFSGIAPLFGLCLAVV